MDAGNEPDGMRRKRAAQYLRMSTDHQRYSLGNQAAAIAVYALGRGYEIVRSYEDAGKSGLTFRGREGLRSLITDVATGDVDFEAVLVLDVSRWGRFQDPDQAAHYEFLCREAGVAVHYCGEPFENDGAMVNSIVKHLKRVMAAEYSRELSEKVRASRMRQIPFGSLLGGPPPYGLRREIRDAEGNSLFVLSKGQRKAIKSDRTWLVRGPPDEVRVTREMFRMYDKEGLCMEEIAKRLNDRGVPSSTSRAWNGVKVRAVLRNELALGIFVFGKTTVRLRERRRAPPEDWVRVQVLPPIIGRAQFNRVRDRLARRERGSRLTKPEMLSRLRRLWKTRGKLTYAAIDKCSYTPKCETYARQFGSVRLAYERIGYVPIRIDWPRTNGRLATNDDLLARLRKLKVREGYVTADLIRSDPNLPSVSVILRRFGSLRGAYELAGFPATHSELIHEAYRRKALRLLDAERS